MGVRNRKVRIFPPSFQERSDRGEPAGTASLPPPLRFFTSAPSAASRLLFPLFRGECRRRGFVIPPLSILYETRQMS
ncbi:hypothetical protein HMPREF9141_2080 [Prevotella multiformis DSM 16608]|uniref:Uncharacterized protein n=1 Tax=Prevotella multiformis DSM 16608 TaxID=888743 RepID=F0F913_9BACT|nr:hypothetical protein HMPREF9141_2080 [Prevotella multiformis DSM 16608]